MKRSLPLERIEGLDAPQRGLQAEEIGPRRLRFGANRIIESTPPNWRQLLIETSKDPMLWFLLGTSLLFGVVGERNEALVLLVALLPFIGMDAFLHRRTQASIAGLSSQLASHADVLRDGARLSVDATDLVAGDLVLLEAGDAVPADGLWVDAESLQLDESALTGEAFPVRKRALADLLRLNGEAQVDAEHWGFAGTRVLTGKATLRVIYTGGETLYGEIVRSALRGSHERTPMQRAVTDLVKTLVVAAVLACVFLAWLRYQQGHGLMDALLSALTLAVAALPEEFPVVLTFFLGVGVYRLAKRQALVRRGVVVENIGRISCICSDKTGTLTEGRLRLAHRYPAEDCDDSILMATATAASRRESADPMDLAILQARPETDPRPRVACFPFTEDRKRETAVMQENGCFLAAAKGAPETILGMCALSPAELATWQGLTQELAEGAHKVIACAWRELDAGQWAGGEPDRGFRLAGLLAFEDPVRAGVHSAIDECRNAGIHVIMVTGDHPATARAVALEIGLGGASPAVITGEEMTSRITAQGDRFLQEIDVIARAIPSQKLELVRTLQGQGEIVAVTGDGVNDVPALQAADIGIAMGGRGTRSAREVAAIVLLDDNFKSIVRAIAEGRQLFSNLQLSFAYLLMIHLPLVATAAMIPMAGYPLLYLPIHIVWLELIIHPTALLVYQNLPRSEALLPIAQPRGLTFFGRGQWLAIIVTGVLVAAVVMVSYDRSLGTGHDVAHARAMALVALTVASAGITAALSRLESLAARMTVVMTICLTVILVQTPALAEHLHLHPLHVDDWMIAVAGGLLAALVPAISPLCPARRSNRPRPASSRP